MDEIQPNLVCQLLAWMGVQKHIFFNPGPWDAIIKFQLQSQFQRFLYQSLCAFSQMKDT